MTLLDIFHIGILVPDLEATAGRLSQSLGVEFIEPMTSRAALFDDRGSTRELELRITYSREGPPHIELLECQGIDGLYGLDAAGLHHVGLWTPEPDAVRDHLTGHGIRIEAAQYDDDSSIIALYTEPSDTGGARFEYVNRTLQGGVDDWLKRAPTLSKPQRLPPNHLPPDTPH